MNRIFSLLIFSSAAIAGNVFAQEVPSDLAPEAPPKVYKESELPHPEQFFKFPDIVVFNGHGGDTVTRLNVPDAKATSDRMYGLYDDPSKPGYNVAWASMNDTNYLKLEQFNFGRGEFVTEIDRTTHHDELVYKIPFSLDACINVQVGGTDVNGKIEECKGNMTFHAQYLGIDPSTEKPRYSVLDFKDAHFTGSKPLNWVGQSGDWLLKHANEISGTRPDSGDYNWQWVEMPARGYIYSLLEAKTDSSGQKVVNEFKEKFIGNSFKINRAIMEREKK